MTNKPSAANQTITVSASGIVATEGREIVAAHLVGGSAAATTALIYDALFADSSLQRIALAAVTAGNDHLTPCQPMIFRKGIFVTLAGSGAILTLVVN